MTDPLRTVILPRSALSALCVVAFLMVLLVALSAGGSTLFFAAGFGCVGAALMLMNLNRPMIFVLALFLWYALAFASSATYFPSVYYGFSFLVQYTDELLLIPLFLMLAMRMVFRQPLTARPALHLWSALLLATALSGVVGGSGIRKTVDFAQSYSRHVILLVMVATTFRGAVRDYRHITLLLNITLAVQLAANLGWLFNINPLPNQRLISQYDWAVGTMGLSAYVNYIAILGIGIYAAALMEQNSPARKLPWLLLLLMAGALCVFGHVKHAIVIAAASLPLSVLVAFRQRPWKRIIYTVILLALLAGVARTYDAPYRQVQRSWMEVGRIWRDLSVKMDTHRDVFRFLTEDRAWVLGKGPGQFCSAVALRHMAPLFVRYFYREIELERFNPQGSIMFYPRTGMLSLLGDIGLLGLGLYLALYGLVVLRILRQFRAGAYDHCLPARRLALGWLQWSIFYFLLNLLTDHMNFSIVPVVTWAGAGLVWNPPPHTEPLPPETTA